MKLPGFPGFIQVFFEGFILSVKGFAFSVSTVITLAFLHFETLQSFQALFKVFFEGFILSVKGFALSVSTVSTHLSRWLDFFLLKLC